MARRAIAAAIVAAVALGAWSWNDRRTRRRALDEQVAAGEPEVAFATLARLTAEPDVEAPRLLDQLRRRDKPLDVLELGVGGVPEEQRGAAVLRVAELAQAIIHQAPEDPFRLAPALWALDLWAAPDPALAEGVRRLRDRMLEPLRRSRPPPPLPGPEDPAWVDLPAGSFRMGGGPGERSREMRRAQPQHPVTVSAFRMMRHEVTNAEYRRFEPGHPGRDLLPAAGIDW